jgi:undecaprenyl-diphosphatase
MTIIQTIFFGIIEGITEFLPISSTGHLILVSHFLTLEQSNFHKSFEIIIQLGAITSVIVLYWKSLLNLETIKKLIVAFLPTGIIGFLFYKIVKTYLFENTNVILWSLFLGGIILIAFEIWNKASAKSSPIPSKLFTGSVQSNSSLDKLSTDSTVSNSITMQTISQDKISQISYKKALLIGFFQSISIIPGVSRSAATIIGGLSLGLDRETVVRFSFLLAVPTMLVASGYDILKNASSFSLDQIVTLALGFVVSFAIAILAIKFFLKFISKHSFIWFGVYRIVLAIVLMLYF